MLTYVKKNKSNFIQMHDVYMFRFLFKYLFQNCVLFFYITFEFYFTFNLYYMYRGIIHIKMKFIKEIDVQ